MMTYIDRLNLLDSDPESSPYHRKTNNEGGPSGPLNIEKARDWEISWENGRAILLQRPNKTTLKKKEIPETTRDTSYDREGSNTGTLPSDPNGPIDRQQFTNKDAKISEEKVMSYVSRLAKVIAKASTFKETINIIKNLFPEIKMRFPNPPTYVWNPKSDNDKKKSGAPLTQGSDAPLDPQAIKDQIKTKIPDIIWESRMTDGIENANIFFTDGSSALFEIGLNANHLTITYTQPDNIEDEEIEPKDPSNPAFTGGI